MPKLAYAAREKTRFPDSTSKAAAQQQADQIKNYWAQRGVEVKTKVVKVGLPQELGGTTIYAVRSDLGRLQRAEWRR